MPEYPPDWYEQGGDESSTPKRPTSVDYPSSALEARKLNRVHNLLERFLPNLRALFVPRDKPSRDA